jgi:hypothetical protein
VAAMIGKFCDAIALVRCDMTIKLGTPVIAAVEVLLTGFHYIEPHRWQQHTSRNLDVR